VDKRGENKNPPYTQKFSDNNTLDLIFLLLSLTVSPGFLQQGIKDRVGVTREGLGSIEFNDASLVQHHHPIGVQNGVDSNYK
jgi:hypothetical protein